MIPTYDEGGKGRKFCPHCNKYVAARTLVCPCGYVFKEGVVGPKPSEDTSPKDLRHQENGRGLRQCPGCKLYISIRIPECPCGHVLEKYVPVVVEKGPTPTFTEGGRGKKRCGGCNLFVGARVLECACGYVFNREAIVSMPAPSVRTSPEAEPIFRETVERDVNGNRCRVIAIPAGKCPVKLASFEQDAVFEWATLVVEHGRSRGLAYKSSALRYWARDYAEYGSPDHKNVCSMLNEMFQSA